LEELSFSQFQSTPPQGGDLASSPLFFHRQNFNPHHRKVVTSWGQLRYMDVWHFNPHHRKVVTKKCGWKSREIANFNPHHRKVVTWLAVHEFILLIISIHTTARW